MAEPKSGLSPNFRANMSEWPEPEVPLRIRGDRPEPEIPLRFEVDGLSPQFCCESEVNGLSPLGSLVWLRRCLWAPE